MVSSGAMKPMDLVVIGIGSLVGAVVATASQQRTWIAGNRRQRVLHEAGHAVLAWRSPYLDLASVTIVPREGLFYATDGGHTDVKTRYPKWQTHDNVFEVSIVLMAGLAGEEMFGDAAKPDTARSDLDEASRLLGMMYPPHAIPSVRETASAWARWRLNGIRDDFGRLCAALDAHETLLAPQLHWILGAPA